MFRRICFKQCEMRSKQKESYSFILKPSLYIRQNREWRIVYHHASVRIICCLIICTRPERAYYFLSVVYMSIVYKPSYYFVLNVRRCVAIICCFFRFEFFNKSFVIVELRLFFCRCLIIIHYALFFNELIVALQERE